MSHSLQDIMLLLLINKLVKHGLLWPPVGQSLQVLSTISDFVSIIPKVTDTLCVTQQPINRFILVYK